MFFICVKLHRSCGNTQGHTSLFLQPLVSLCLSVNVHQKPHINTDTQKQDEMCLHLPSVCVFMSSTRCRGWSRPCLSHRLRMEDYGWPITSLLSLINEDNELPLLPTKPWCSSAGTEQREGCWGLCVKVCV